MIDRHSARTELELMVGRGGFEPPISWSQTRRFAGLSHRPPGIEDTRSAPNSAGTRGRWRSRGGTPACERPDKCRPMRLGGGSPTRR
jgi:hypothetical protein